MSEMMLWKETLLEGHKGFRKPTQRVVAEKTSLEAFFLFLVAFHQSRALRFIPYYCPHFPAKIITWDVPWCAVFYLRVP